MAGHHEIFKKAINDDTFQFLEWLYKHASPKIENRLMARIYNISEIQEISTDKLQSEDFLLKIETLYLRYCYLVEHLIKEYQDLESGKKCEIIDYYIFNNSLKELNFLGMGFYYDCKYKRTTATLYKGRSKQVNWQLEASKETKKSKVGTEAVKEMFKACREHINTGGDVELKSYSKSFVLDLFKYISLYQQPKGQFLADVYVKENADLNIIHIQDQTLSLQQYIVSDIRLENTEFVIDFSEPRNYDRENFYRWYKSFMDDAFGSGSNATPNIDNYKDIQAYFQDYLSYNLNQAENRTQVSLMVSPVSDREVVMSGDLWNTVDFESMQPIENAIVHFSFDEEELFELIIAYHISFFNKQNHTENPNLIQAFRNDVIKTLDELQKQINNNVESNPASSSDKTENTIRKLEAIKSIVLYECNNPKILGLLSMIDWQYENTYWSKENIEKLDFKKIYNKSNENLFVNILKFICTDAARRNYFGI